MSRLLLSYTIYKDAGGRIGLLHNDVFYYLHHLTKELYCSRDVEWIDKAGRKWRTPHIKKVTNKHIHERLLTAHSCTGEKS